MQNYPNLRVDLSNCDKEPIHIIGRIQPHGFMFILNRKTLEIEQVSENVSQFLDTVPSPLTGTSLKTILTASEYEALLPVLDGNTQDAHLLYLQGKKFFGFIHVSAGSLVLECEPFVASSSDEARLELTNSYLDFQVELEAAGSLEKQSELVADFVQQQLNYDRVMIYRFDENWNGEVIAEKVKPGVHSYLYHHFPATDIPAQARALLVQKPIRQIADVAATAINIVPYINPQTGAPSNIIASELRNPSEIHLEYLRNMNVQATLSVSILVKGKLWGIIACQHESAVFIDYWKRHLCRNVAQAYANAVVANQETRDLHLLEQNKQKEEKLLQQVFRSGSVGEGLFEGETNLLQLTDATGAALFLDNKLYTIGITPAEDQIIGLLDWLSESVQSRVFFTHALSKELPAASTYTAQASGLLAMEISRFKKEYILYFKAEIQEKRIWAGNPEKPAYADHKSIHPRKSFKKWTELVKGKSMPWSVNELEITQHLLKDIVSVILKRQADALEKLNKELKMSTRALNAKNKRLEEFAHIISHNLRSPLSNMQGLANMYHSEQGKATRTEVMQLMQTMIRNMAETIDDVNLILKQESEQGLERQQVDLQEVVQKELQGLHAAIQQSKAEITTDLQKREFIVPKVYLESIVHNLLSNALKYSSPDRAPVVSIKSWQKDGTGCIMVSDNGLGMNLAKTGNRLFSMYATFHKNKDAKGLGLYLAKTQTEALGGTIKVESAPDKGTTFVVCLPAVP